MFFIQFVEFYGNIDNLDTQVLASVLLNVHMCNMMVNSSTARLRYCDGTSFTTLVIMISSDLNSLLQTSRHITSVICDTCELSTMTM